jgi:hypothetical protein
MRPRAHLFAQWPHHPAEIHREAGITGRWSQGTNTVVAMVVVEWSSHWGCQGELCPPSANRVSRAPPPGCIHLERGRELRLCSISLCNLYLGAFLKIKLWVVQGTALSWLSPAVLR